MQGRRRPYTSYEFTSGTPSTTTGQLPFCFETVRIYYFLPPVAPSSSIITSRSRAPRGEGSLCRKATMPPPIVLCLALLASTGGARATISTSWRPILPAALTEVSVLHQEASAFYGTSIPVAQSLYDADASHHGQETRDQCALYKVSMNQQLYFEYIQYKTDIPDMKELTLCMWSKFHNHTNDHPLFSYAVGDQPRGILSWVANTPRSSYFMLNVGGHTLYRLNYPLRLNKWYHSCQSWNGRTGEWQIWVNDERVGRGFNNRLVDHVIKGGGIAITGQEQRQMGGGFLEGKDAPPGSGGMLGEITMVQLYAVALSAGKAHKDHKHHHAHHYEHDTSNNIPQTTTRAPMTGPPLPSNPFLTGGQINPQVKLNPGAPIQIVQNGITMRHPAFPPIPPPQPFPPINNDNPPTVFPLTASLAPRFQTEQIFNPSNPQQLSSKTVLGGIAGIAGTVAPLTFTDGSRYHSLFKREKNLFKRQSVMSEGVTVSNTNLDNVPEPDGHNDEGQHRAEKLLTKRHAAKVTTSADSNPSLGDKVITMTRDDAKKMVGKRETEGKTKRDIVQLSDGSIYDDNFSTASQGLDNDYFSGLANFGIQLPRHKTKDEEREPAEAEVRRVMDVCDGCTEEPFEKALIMGWRSVPKKLYSGALHVPAVQACKAF